MATTLTATGRAYTLYAAFDEAAQAEKAAGALLDHGVRPADISIVRAMGNTGYERDSPDEAGARDNARRGITTTTAGDAEAGAAKGAGFGLGVGALAALASLLVPGVGIVVGGGALAMAIAGAAGATAAGAVAGGVTGYLRDQGVPDDALGRYGQAYDAGNTLIAVTVPSNNVDVVEADEILSKYNGKHINSY